MARIRVAGHTLAELDELSDHGVFLVDTALHEVATRVAASLSTAITAAGFDELNQMNVSLNLWNDEVDARLAPYVADVYESGALAVGLAAANGMNLGAGQGIPAITSDHVAQHLAHAKNRLSGIGDDLWHNARTSLLEGYSLGESQEQLAVRVQAAAGVTAGRARTIARTEIISASNAGSLAQVHLVAGDTDQKEWLATMDSRTREDHVHADGQRVDLHQPFTVGGWTLQYPGDPAGPASETVNCRCTLAYVLDDTPSVTCSCAGALTSAHVPQHPVQVTSESCLCPASTQPHGHGVAELPPLTAADKQAVYDSFKAQGPISPAYGGAKIYKHLQSMPDLEGLGIDEFQALKIIDEVYLKSGGKSSFSEKFDEWLASAAGKKTTGGLEKSVISHTVKHETTQVAKPVLEVHDKANISAEFWSHMGYADPGDAAAVHLAVKKTTAEFTDLGLTDTDVLEVLLEVEGKHTGPTLLEAFQKGEAGLGPPQVPHVDIPKPIVEKPPLPSEAAVQKDLTDISHVPGSVVSDWYEKFKSVKPVTPGWGGSAVYKTLQQAKELVKNDPAYHGLNDAQLLKMLDQVLANQGKTGAKTYLGEVSQWVGTPAGKKAVEKQLAGVKHTTSSVQPLKTETQPTAPSPTAHSQSGDISHLTGIVKNDLFNSVKGKGVYLSSPPDKLYAAIQQVKDNYPEKYGNVNDLQALRILDEVGAKKLGVEDKHLYEKKVVDWLQTSAGKKAALEANMSPAEKAALTAKKLAEQQKKAEEVAKKFKVDTSTVPAFDAGVSSDTFRQVSVDTAQAMQNEMSRQHGAWTPTQRAALKHYTGGSYSEMNNHLRRGSHASEKNLNAIANAQQGMRPSTRAILVHRGTGFNQIGVSNADQARQLVGKTLQDRGFMSTSAGGHAAFGGAVLMEIECPAGTPMAFVKSISHYKSENEMLLAAGLKYRVLSVRQTGHQTVVRVRIIP